ncbi:unnamed protein product [Rotaria magnacalcarata]|uniref:NYN domain-containing protein n=1 Tax=Rotaria magnacalcarata TaxID=392030 RepID=A0A819KQS6_9BILA|nr:unnamed protein product [Rotaria magnacalcarata]
MKRTSIRNSPKVLRSACEIHIVVDNSNLFIGSQNGQGINRQQDTSDIKTRLVGGSTPPRTSRIWNEWEKCNYTCLLGDRSILNKEVFLDDMLHSQIQNLILRNNSHQGSVQQRLVLITGDGNANDNRTSFPDIVNIALDYGWTVELWSWGTSMNKKFSDIQRRNPSKMQINYLDQYRSKITFKQKQQQQKVNNQLNSWFSPVSIFVLCLGIFLCFFLIYWWN